MPDVKRNVRIVTEQNTITDRPSGVEGFPLRQWSVEIFLLNDKEEEMEASIFSKATYLLHDSFGDRAKQTITKPPFRINEEGWGEFEMNITLTGVERGGDHTVLHDLNFQNNRYETKHTITFKNPKPGLIDRLRESGPVPGDEAGKKKAGEESAKKKKRADKGINMDKLAENLQRLGEEDLLQVVQMIYDNKSSDSHIKNNIDAGEFEVDLYSLPDSLVQMLWNFSEEKAIA